MNSIYMLLGPESGEKEKFIETIRKEIISKTKEEPEVHKFYPFDTSAGDIIALMKNGSLFSSHKLVFLNEAQDIKREDIKPYCEYLKNPSKDVTFIIKSSQISISKPLTAAVAGSNKKIFWELFENQKRSWIIAYFHRSEVKIDHKAVELMLEMVNNNTDDMRKICEKLILFFGGGVNLTYNMIENFIYHSKEENVFTLFEPIASGNLSSALEILQKIQLSGEAHPVHLFAGLLYQFRKLHNLTVLCDQQYNLQDAFKKLKIGSKRNQKLFSVGIKQYTSAQVKKIIVLIAKYDAQIRTIRTDLQKISLQLFLYYCIIKKGAEPEEYSDS